ncbi:hypothetical protein [Geminicoccus flavidas]|uniref:hypothetical protein n=1 Tax=Geminicoccus flavidas TaxID=2506407 RepID=UPI00135C90C0|nr:hypothetical protein [Geminicoccus flavidas]
MPILHAGDPVIAAHADAAWLAAPSLPGRLAHLFRTALAEAARLDEPEARQVLVTAGHAALLRQHGVAELQAGELVLELQAAVRERENRS